MSNDITYDEDTGRYEKSFDGPLVFARTHLAGNVLTIEHVEAAQELRGQGAAGIFMKEFMEIVRRKNLKVIPLCGYAAAWLGKHSEYDDLKA